MEVPLMTIISSMGGQIYQFTFCQDNIRFGKHPDNEIWTSGHSRRVNRNHAVMRWDGQKWLIRDLKTVYGTYVNGHRIERDTESDVKSGDRIAIGDIELEVRY
jgi:pSer/pThr/pTyr-binding forkhead associated (FHA) protein